VQVIISGRRVALSASFKTTVERKVEKLARVLPRILDVRVVCAREKFQRRVRLTVRAQRGTFSTTSLRPDFLSAVEEGVETLARQARERKERRTRRRQGGPDLVAPRA
jgi:ribosomal subunit interface protein